MVSIAFIMFLAVLTFLMIAGIVYFTIFWFKIVIEFRKKEDDFLITGTHKSGFENISEDPEAIGQLIYMRRKLMGG